MTVKVKPKVKLFRAQAGIGPDLIPPSRRGPAISLPAGAVECDDAVREALSI
jgi:hypothetical protein